MLIDWISIVIPYRRKVLKLVQMYRIVEIFRICRKFCKSQNMVVKFTDEQYATINSCVLLISEFRYYQRNYEPL